MRIRTILFSALFAIAGFLGGAFASPYIITLPASNAAEDVVVDTVTRAEFTMLQNSLKTLLEREESGAEEVKVEEAEAMRLLTEELATLTVWKEETMQQMTALQEQIASVQEQIVSTHQMITDLQNTAAAPEAVVEEIPVAEPPVEEAPAEEVPAAEPPVEEAPTE